MGIVHYNVCALKGNRTMDHELEDIPAEIQRDWRRSRSSFKLANPIVSEAYLTFTKALGSAGTFLLFAGFSLIGLIFIYFLVPETKGMRFEEVEKLLQKGFRPKLFAPKDTKAKLNLKNNMSRSC
ncbi:hypothetical protein ACFX13_005442 [Malus domestica]|uniref:Major facilitator superfamily (MFS) profile domain-containing protein n=1 Tax=Malus domestica TaxID=3750 RepID=A0A498IWX6_MALDO|nr:hypothetical protein DVH24_014385 [Malus domestica]